MKKIGIVDKLLSVFEKCVVDEGCRILEGFENRIFSEAETYFPRTVKAHNRGVDLTDTMRKIRYQGSAPSCVGFAMAHAIQIREGVLREEGKISRNTIPSENWLYWWPRFVNGDIGVPLTGTPIPTALDQAKLRGCPAARFRKYSTDPKKLNAEPTARQEMAAKSRKGLDFKWIRGDRTMNCIQALEEGKPVIFRTQVTSALSSYKKGDVIFRPGSNEKLLGNHAMVIGGYRVVGDGYHFLVVNSWRGRELPWFDSSYIEWGRTGDLAVVDFPKEAR